MAWSREFLDPITLENGRKRTTLREAASYGRAPEIGRLPYSLLAMEALWQVALENTAHSQHLW